MKLTRLSRLALVVLLSGGVAVACNDDDEPMEPEGPTIEDLAGTWDASSAVFTADTVDADMDGMPDVIPLVQLGATVTLEVTAQERFTFTIVIPGSPTQTVEGDFEIDGSNVTVTNDDDPDDPVTGTFSLSEDGDTLSVTLNEVELVDFDMDGNDDSATLQAAFDRVS